MQKSTWDQVNSAAVWNSWISWFLPAMLWLLIWHTLKVRERPTLKWPWTIWDLCLAVGSICPSFVCPCTPGGNRSSVPQILGLSCAGPGVNSMILVDPFQPCTFCDNGTCTNFSVLPRGKNVVLAKCKVFCGCHLHPQWPTSSQCSCWDLQVGLS